MFFCEDNDECQTDDYDDDPTPDEGGICGDNAQCINTIGSFYCKCLEGFLSSQTSAIFSPESSVVCHGR